jgi:hypothetical protein
MNFICNIFLSVSYEVEPLIWYSIELSARVLSAGYIKVLRIPFRQSKMFSQFHIFWTGLNWWSFRVNKNEFWAELKTTFLRINL